MKFFSGVMWVNLFVLVFAVSASAQQNTNQNSDGKRRHDSIASGIHIYPGLWRPVFNTEQIAWISPPWLNEGYIWADFPKATEFIWFDFPKAIFSSKGLLFLSHVNPSITPAYGFPQIQQVPWVKIPGNGISYKQKLPNGLEFGGAVRHLEDSIVSLDMSVKNNGDSILSKLMLLTCIYLDPVKEFSEKTNNNKFVHTKNHGWITLEKAMQINEDIGLYPVNWSPGSKKVADLPVIVAVSSNKQHLIAYTWWNQTAALWGNGFHPSFNADPYIPDLAPGQEVRIKGNIIFFQGSIDDFEDYFTEKLKRQSESNSLLF